MKKVSWKMLKTALLLLIAGAILIFIGAIYWPFILVSFIPLAAATYIMIKKMRCPHCGEWENLERLMYARNHKYHCRSCGKVIEIDWEG